MISLNNDDSIIDAMQLAFFAMLFALLLWFSGGGCAPQTGLEDFGRRGDTWTAPAGTRDDFDMGTYDMSIRSDGQTVHWQILCRNRTPYRMIATFTPGLSIYSPEGTVEWEARIEPVTRTIEAGGQEWFDGTFSLPGNYRGKEIELMGGDKHGRTRFAPRACGAAANAGGR